jgi:hypothetical protein
MMPEVRAGDQARRVIISILGPAILPVTVEGLFMTPFDDVRVACAPPRPGVAQRLLRRVCTSNPFYVLSAGLFLAGLRASFGAQADAVETWAMTSGLAGYTLLLAVTAGLLVRFGNVWDDVRTVLLLVVLMFLATSVTFDEVLVLSPERGLACCLGGLLFAVAVSEGTLRGIRLALPAQFRVPYYLLLSLFFLYPLALTPLVERPHSEGLMWGLFGFATAAGLVFLTLLPAIRRGAAYVQGNGSPWRWPLYPWTLFGLFALAVPSRAVLLCWSMHLLPMAEQGQLIFGPYFLLPFGLALAVLFLEIGLASEGRRAVGLALVVPVGLLALALIGHRPDPIYRTFLDMFTARLGGDPLYLTLLATAGLYAYAALRRVPVAVEALTAMLAALAVVGPHTLKLGALVEPRPLPILAAAALQTGLGLWRGQVWRCAFGAGGLVLGTTLALPESAALRTVIAFHLGLVALLGVGAAFDHVDGRRLRGVGVVLVLFACLGTMFEAFPLPGGVPAWVVQAYPPVMALLLAGYGLLLVHRPSLVTAAVVLGCWLGVTGWAGYRALRLVVVGLDHIAVSLLLFGLAILVSLGKSGALARWLAAHGWLAPALGRVRAARHNGDPRAGRDDSGYHDPVVYDPWADPGSS